MKVVAIIPSAGKGKRMAHSVSKHFIRLEDKPVLAYTLEAFEKCPDVNQVLLVVRSGEEKYCLKEVVEKYQFRKVLKVVIGGERRQDSVYNGIKELDQDTDIVVVHDGVRPFVPPALISETIKLAMYVDGVVAALPVKDTIKEVTRDGLIKGTPNRDSLWFAQTPQTFKKRVLEEAFMRAFTDKFHGTDEASLVERMGGKVKIIEGSHENIKITTKEDLFYAELILRSRRKKET
ncbi:MAG: 2-C-methyl-D-erythritol 4-phosphate cytidylyltransferase [Nitrospirae bacterium RIFCSPHIGHO2_02_FULL_40_19]|nr:MAG: 2-C-methyl-D-erythritol 4-phosphate cytidylyltransferase [Nitrospirae bacterium RIFCSPHIGHO2_02_FULL_40_19]